jgi:hypothetical protein
VILAMQKTFSAYYVFALQMAKSASYCCQRQFFHWGSCPDGRRETLRATAAGSFQPLRKPTAHRKDSVMMTPLGPRPADHSHVYSYAFRGNLR